MGRQAHTELEPLGLGLAARQKMHSLSSSGDLQLIYFGRDFDW